MKKFQTINYLLSIVSIIYIVINIIEFIQYYPNYAYELSDIPLDLLILFYSISTFLFTFYSNKFLLYEEINNYSNNKMNTNKLKTLTIINMFNSAITLFFSAFVFYNFYTGVIKDFKIDYFTIDLILIPIIGIIVLIFSIAQFYYSKIILKKMNANTSKII